MKNDWLTIPDAPNYEINSELICRNRRTKKLLKIFRDSKNFRYYSLHSKDKSHTIKRNPKTFRSQAEAAAVHGTFEPLPSFNGAYEINKCGVLRNSNTKIVRKTNGSGKSYNLKSTDGKYISVSIASLLWEAHGIIFKRRFRPCPCTIERDGQRFTFPNMNACARFLSPKVYLSARGIADHLNRREAVVFGWRVTYHDNDLSDVKWNSVALSTLARRQAKLDKLAGLSC